MIFLELDLRLRTLVREAYTASGGSWQGLEKEIARVNLGAASVDRRKLARIADATGVRDRTVHLSVHELSALQTYFVRKQVLKLDDNMLFEYPQSLLSGFSNASEVTIFLPTRYLPSIATECASRWDVQAAENLLRAQQLAGLRIDLEDVYHFGAKYQGEELQQKITREAWYKKLRGKSIISIGSPYVSYSTTQLLGWFCGITSPFEQLSAADSARLPFRFYWPDRTAMSDSAFSISKEQLQEEFADSLGNFDPAERGLVVGDNWYPAQSENLSHELIVAQQYKGNFILVLSAIHAPATLGIAKLVANGKIPISRSGMHTQSQFLHIAVTTTRFEEQADEGEFPRDLRNLVKTELVGPPRVWNTVTHAWDD